MPDIEILNLKKVHSKYKTCLPSPPKKNSDSIFQIWTSKFSTLDVLSKLEGLWLNRDLELIYAVACRLVIICFFLHCVLRIVSIVFHQFRSKVFFSILISCFYMLPSYRITWICPMTFDNFPLDVQVLWYWTVPGNQSKSTLFIGWKELDLIWFRSVAFKLAASTMTSPRSSSRTSLWLSRARSSEFWRKSESEESQ